MSGKLFERFIHQKCHHKSRKSEKSFKKSAKYNVLLCCFIFQIYKPTLALVAENIDLTKPTHIASDSSSGSSSSSSSDSEADSSSGSDSGSDSDSDNVVERKKR